MFKKVGGCWGCREIIILVKSNIPKSKFDVFGVREDCSLNIQNMR